MRRKNVIFMSAMVALSVIFCGLTAYNTMDKSLSQKQAAGKVIYEKGIGDGEKEIKAVLSGVEVPASVLFCASCHGKNGEGKPEGGVSPSNLTWKSLTKNYLTKTKNGRQYPAYDARSLKRAITMGIDPAGNHLSSVMPRYQMSLDELTNLIEYIKILGSDLETGLTDTSIHIGMFLPSPKKFPTLHKTMKEVVEAHFAEVNQNGGIYNRQLRLLTNKFSDNSDQPLEMLTNLIDSKEVFAMTGSYLAGQDHEIIKLINKHEIPVIGAFSEYPEGSSLRNKNVFFLYSGIKQQIDALIQHTTTNISNESAKVALIYSDEMDDIGSIVEQLAIGNKKINLIKHRIVKGDDQIEQMVRDLKNSKVESILYLGPKESGHKMLNYAASIEFTPELMLLGAFSSIDVFAAPHAFDKKILLSYPTWFTEFNNTGISIYEQLSSKYNLSSKYKNMQFAALASAILLTNGLKEIGSNPSKEKLINNLEGLYDYQTGLIPPVTFSANGRIGSERTYITELDLQQKKLVLINTINGKSI